MQDLMHATADLWLLAVLFYNLYLYTSILLFIGAEISCGIFDRFYFCWSWIAWETCIEPWERPESISKIEKCMHCYKD
jgi:hypothetical protein